MSPFGRVLSGLLVGLSLAGCGPSQPGTPRATRLSDEAELTLTATVDRSLTVLLDVEYAVAGLTPCDADPGDQAMVFFSAFGDGRIAPDLDLTTMSLTVDLSDERATPGPADFIVEGSEVSLYLESADTDTPRLLAANQVSGTVHLRYEAPPRAGGIIEGTLQLRIDDLERADGSLSTFTLNGSFEVPVVRTCP